MISKRKLNHSYRLTYALFRLAETIKHPSLSVKLSELAVSLHEGTVSGNLREVLDKIEKIRSIVYLASDIGQVSDDNKMKLEAAFTSFIDGLEYEEEQDDVDVSLWLRDASIGNKEEGNFRHIDGIRHFSGISSENGVVRKGSEIKGGKKDKNEGVTKELVKELPISNKKNIIDNDKKMTIVDSGSDLDSNDKEDVVNKKEATIIGREEFSVLNKEKPKREIEISEKGKIDSEERKKFILHKIEQDGICFLKDIAELLPNYSERTLRYDLEQLSRRGVVEKIGSSGPGTFYRAKRGEVK